MRGLRPDDDVAEAVAQYVGRGAVLLGTLSRRGREGQESREATVGLPADPWLPVPR